MGINYLMRGRGVVGQGCRRVTKAQLFAETRFCFVFPFCARGTNHIVHGGAVRVWALLVLGDQSSARAHLALEVGGLLAWLGVGLHGFVG